ncbi:DGQHR domain-containing protein [Malaciobacter sp. WC5094]
MKKIPAIRGTIGNWVYYCATLTLNEIKENVKPINNELHRSKSLSDAIQRSISDNFKAIKDYILNQEERFFNSLVLAVYDGNPNWVEVELELEGEEFFNLGFLTLTGEEKIFPVDGQHRVEGIKAAVTQNSELGNDKIPVIFIGHQKTDDGMQKTRRLFSTLNRYAKPVSAKDIVALDEDDIIAITTRYFVESYDLFKDNRVVFSLQKNIHDSNKDAFTSLITLSNCIEELFKYYFYYFFKKTGDYKSFIERYFPERNSVGVKDFKRFRPKDEVIDSFIEFCKKYWDSFIMLEDIQTYLKSSIQPAKNFRNREKGGNILFRPIGILPFVQATIEDSKLFNFENLEDVDFEKVIKDFLHMNFKLNEKPWKHIAWDPNTSTMKTTGNRKLIKLLFLYYANIDNISRLSENDLNYIKENYASFIGYDDDISTTNLESLLNN